jgi:hypothetical protein
METGAGSNAVIAPTFLGNHSAKLQLLTRVHCERSEFSRLRLGFQLR